MIIRLYIWHGATGWLAFCPQLQVGVAAATRGQALRKARDDASREARLRWGEGTIVVIDGPPSLENA